MRKSRLVIAFVAAILTGLLTGIYKEEASADYIPGKAFIAQMMALVEKAPMKIYSLPNGVMAAKVVRVGTTYQAGEVAYFFIMLNPESGDLIDTGMQLEEWKLLDNGDFLVTYSKMSPNRMMRWSLILTTSGFLVLDMATSKDEDFTPDSPEAIKTSERTQEILKRAGNQI